MKQLLLLIIAGSISWYASGNYKDGSKFDGTQMSTACYKEYRGRTFRVTYKNKTIEVKCNDTGKFETNGSGRVLDLSKAAFVKLAPASQGIIRGAKIEIL